jgi:hypothetical protein
VAVTESSLGAGTDEWRPVAARYAGYLAATEETSVKTGVKHFIVGGVLIFLSTLFIPQGISDLAGSAARGEPVDPGSPVLLAIGAVLVVTAIVLFARGHVLQYRARARAAGQRQD